VARSPAAAARPRAKHGSLPAIMTSLFPPQSLVICWLVPGIDFSDE